MYFPEILLMRQTVEEVMFERITVCLDMYGCPNRCKHCWVGHSSNGNLTKDDLIYVAEKFRPFTNALTVYDWYREPDYRDNYQELWDLCSRLSDVRENHFELISVWRIVRDREYVKWLSALGLKKAQLTLFGGRKTTDLYTGRKNAYNEILEAIDILLANQISPRIQMFVNKDNIGELPLIETLITKSELEKRCRSFGGEFSFFMHQGSCDGENEKLYDIRVTPEDLEKIPQKLVEYTLKHFNETKIENVFGKTEQALYEELIHDHSTASYVSETPVFYIDKDFSVYPNITAPAPAWFLGNLKTEGIETILKNYTESKSVAQAMRLTVPLCDIVASQGDCQSQRLFDKGDYIDYLTNKYCRK